MKQEPNETERRQGVTKDECNEARDQRALVDVQRVEIAIVTELAEGSECRLSDLQDALGLACSAETPGLDLQLEPETFEVAGAEQTKA